MIAAAAASICCLRTRQSFSRIARRLSASRLVRRSSCSTIGRPVRAPSCDANASTRSVISVREPSRRRGRPITTTATSSSSAARRSISAAADCTAAGPSALHGTTPTGRASVRLGSLIATPIRRAPMSRPTMRVTPYNSRTPERCSHARRRGRFSLVTTPFTTNPCSRCSWPVQRRWPGTRKTRRRSAIGCAASSARRNSWHERRGRWSATCAASRSSATSAARKRHRRHKPQPPCATRSPPRPAGWPRSRCSGRPRRPT